MIRKSVKVEVEEEHIKNIKQQAKTSFRRPSPYKDHQEIDVELLFEDKSPEDI